jgi:hypothetical protein
MHVHEVSPSRLTPHESCFSPYRTPLPEDALGSVRQPIASIGEVEGAEGTRGGLVARARHSFSLARQEREAERAPAGVAQAGEGARPHPRARPADVQLRRLPPWPQFGRHRPPPGAVALAPDHCLDRAPLVRERPPRPRPRRVRRSLQPRPLGTAQDSYGQPTQASAAGRLTDPSAAAPSGSAPRARPARTGPPWRCRCCRAPPPGRSRRCGHGGSSRRGRRFAARSPCRG